MRIEARTTRRRCLTVVVAFVVALFAFAPVAHATTARGQGISAAKLSKAVKLPNGKKSSMTFTLELTGGSRIRGYAVSSTLYYERGPNDTEYHKVSRSTAYTAFKNWGGSGSFPVKFVYKKYRSKGKTYRVLSRVYYFMEGE